MMVVWYSLSSCWNCCMSCSSVGVRAVCVRCWSMMHFLVIVSRSLVGVHGVCCMMCWSVVEFCPVQLLVLLWSSCCCAVVCPSARMLQCFLSVSSCSQSCIFVVSWESWCVSMLWRCACGLVVLLFVWVVRLGDVCSLCRSCCVVLSCCCGGEEVAAGWLVPSCSLLCCGVCLGCFELVGVTKIVVSVAVTASVVSSSVVLCSCV